MIQIDIPHLRTPYPPIVQAGNKTMYINNHKRDLESYSVRFRVYVETTCNSPIAATIT